MAHAQEKSGDYRVLRRLVPRDVFTPVPVDQQIKVGVLFDVETTGWTRKRMKSSNWGWSSLPTAPTAESPMWSIAGTKLHRDVLVTLGNS
jgi:hypothetical protein